MSAYSGFGYGKLILCGEHAVVYGEPAIAFAVGAGTRATLTSHDGPTFVEHEDAHPELLAAVHDVCGTRGWMVSLQSDLPIGRGMGSSAALAAALARARAEATRTSTHTDALYEAALPVEQRFHGNPSGIDLSCAIEGGARWFVRGDPPINRPLTMPDFTFVVMDTGIVSDTATQVAHVASNYPNNTPLLRAIGETVHACRRTLQNATELGALLNENHRLLTALGVSTPALDGLVAVARREGALGAKLAGAGGGGVAFALCEDMAHGEAVLAGLHALGAQAWLCQPQRSSV